MVRVMRVCTDCGVVFRPREAKRQRLPHMSWSVKPPIRKLILFSKSNMAEIKEHKILRSTCCVVLLNILFTARSKNGPPHAGVGSTAEAVAPPRCWVNPVLWA
jgi:hypothetical protein